MEAIRRVQILGAAARLPTATPCIPCSFGLLQKLPLLLFRHLGKRQGVDMSVEDRRQQRKSQNDQRIKEYRQNSPRQRRQEPIELACECGQNTCSTSIHVTPSYYDQARNEPTEFLCAKSHDVPQLEIAHHPFGGKEATETDFVIADTTWLWDKKVDTETLKAQVDALDKENSRHNQELTTTLTRINTSTASGVLILGIFTALRPEQAKSLPILLVVPALALLVALVGISLYIPRSIRRLLRKRFDVFLISMEELAEWERNRYQPSGLPERLRENLAPGATYETFELLEEARKFSPLLPHALLPYQDWLVLEVQRQARLRSAYRDAEESAHRGEGNVLSLLVLLVGYVVVISLVV
jgi:hypothetical protein